MISRSGVYYNLALSEYRVKRLGVTYVFSSKLHMEKFTERVLENRSNINQSLSKRFKIDINVDILADIVLYSKIENRGFLILNEENEEITPENVIFKGGKALIKCR